MDVSSTLSREWYGHAVKTAVISMPCYGVPEGGSRRGAAPLPLAVALLTKADQVHLANVVAEVYDRLGLKCPDGEEGERVLDALHDSHTPAA